MVPGMMAEPAVVGVASLPLPPLQRPSTTAPLMVQKERPEPCQSIFFLASCDPGGAFGGLRF